MLSNLGKITRQTPPEATNVDITVLLILEDCRGDNGIYPAIATVARRAHLAARTVQRSLTHLQELGLITVHRRHDPENPSLNLPNAYVIRYDRFTAEEVDDPSEAPAAPFNSEPVTAPSATERALDGLEATTPARSTAKPAHAAPSEPAGFGAFYGAYPRHVGRRAAVKAYRQALKRADAETILDGARRLAQDPNLPEPRFIAYPATWLNRDGWGDDPQPARDPQAARPAVASPWDTVEWVGGASA